MIIIYPTEQTLAERLERRMNAVALCAVMDLNTLHARFGLHCHRIEMGCRQTLGLPTRWLKPDPVDEDLLDPAQVGQ